MRGKVFHLTLSLMFSVLFILNSYQPGQAAFGGNPVLQNPSSQASSSAQSADVTAQETAMPPQGTTADSGSPAEGAAAASAFAVAPAVASAAASAAAPAGTTAPIYGPVRSDIGQAVDPAPLLAAPGQPVLVAPANGATGVSTNATLTVRVSDPDGGTLKVSFYGRQKSTTTTAPFSLAVIPDTQNYVVDADVAAYFNAITQYIVDHQAERNFAFVTDMGDITNTGNTDTDDSEWVFADTAYSILDRSSSTYTDDVPYSMMPGNHDYLGNSLSHFESHFGVSRFSGRPYYGGHYGSDNSNNFSIFSASGMHFIVINLSCVGSTPSSAVLNWADSLLKDDVSRRGIVACHSILEDDSSFSSEGSAIYTALKDNPNLFLMLAGHAAVGRRSDLGSDGHTINTVMADYSAYQNGGDGWFRIMEFRPANNQIQVSTYSPTQDDGAGGYMTGSTHEFALNYAMRSPDFSLIDTVTAASGANASVTWPGLADAAEYEWYAVARDADSVTLGTTQSFTTGSSTPVLRAVSDTYTTSEDTQLTVSAPGVLSNDTDPNQAPLTAVKVSNPGYGTVTLNSNGSFTYSPAGDFKGTDSFTYKANNGSADSNVATVTITVNPVNDAPVCQAVSLSTSEDTVGSANPGCTDVDGDSLTYSVVGQPTHGDAVWSGGKLQYTPDTEYSGADSFTYKANDGKLDSSAATVTVTITAVNDAPVCQAVSLSTSEDTIGNTSPACTDADGNSLTYSVIGQPTHGDALWSGGKLQYTPDADYNGGDSFTYKANDGKLDSSAATVTVTVTAVKDAPVASNGSLTTKEDTPGPALLSGSDADGDSLTYSVVKQPAHGSLSGTAPALTYSPVGDYNGTDSFTYRVNDGELDSNVATIAITITPVNDAPVCQAVSATIHKNTTADMAALCQDVDSSSLSYVIDGAAQHGNASVVNGKLHYQPDLNYTGEDHFSYKAYDGALYSSSAQASISIDDFNYPPVLDSLGSPKVNEGALLEFTATATDIDTPQDALVFSLSGDVPAGAVIGSDGHFRWTPGEEQGPNSYSFQVCVSDGVTGLVCRDVTVRVDEVNQPAVLAKISDQRALKNRLLTFTVTAQDVDLPANTLTFRMDSKGAPAGANLDPSTGVFMWKPGIDEELRTYNFEICVSDGTESTCQVVSITVNEAVYLPMVRR